MTKTSQASELAKEVAGDIVIGNSQGSAVKGLREKTGLTQRELADILDTTREQVSRVENGHVPPSIDFVRDLSRAVAVSEVAREMEVRGELDGRRLRRVATRLGLEDEDVDTLLINGLLSLDEKRRNLVKEL